MSVPNPVPNPDAVPDPDADNNKMMGGRRHRKQGHKTRKEPNVLKSWRKFVRKVQHEEHLSYPKAMKRASKRKSEWQRGGGEEEIDDDDGQNTGTTSTSTGATGGRRSRSRKQRGGEGPVPVPVPDEEEEEEEGDLDGGRRRRRRRRTRRQRGGNAPSSSVSDFDGNYSKQYGSVGGSRKRRHHIR
jgi:hypothetical protein